MHQIVLYTKEGCHLCEAVKAKLMKLQQEFNLAIEEVDITQDPALLARYRHVIPVVIIDGETELVSKITEYHLRKSLSEKGSVGQTGKSALRPFRHPRRH